MVVYILLNMDVAITKENVKELKKRNRLKRTDQNKLVPGGSSGYNSAKWIITE